MEMLIDFPGGNRVDAHFDKFTLKTDQPPEASAPSPFETFLASIGTCAGIYILGFCRRRSIPTEGIRIVQRMIDDPETRLVGRIDLEIQVPPGFPEKYIPAMENAAKLCMVKKHLEHPPDFKIFTKRAKATT